MTGMHAPPERYGFFASVVRFRLLLCFGGKGGNASLQQQTHFMFTLQAFDAVVQSDGGVGLND